MPAARPSLLRDRNAREQSKVTFVELFFDLVFVFAITQLSHLLLAHLTLAGALVTAFLLGAVWCVWIYTVWATNWLDTSRTPVRVMVFVIMAAGLLLSTSIPEAFGTKGLAFAAAYAFMQNARNLFLLRAIGDRDPPSARTFGRIQAWFLVSAACWIAGGVGEGATRVGFWVIALAAELGSPWIGFWTPGLGRSPTTDWRVSAHHFAERAGLFIIIALGESILVIGATFAELAWTPAHGAAFAVALGGAIAMWWVYFATTADEASEELARHEDPGRLARGAYTYSHLPMVAGIIVAAVGNELLLAHPTGHVGAAPLATMLGGPALFLVGSALFNRMMCGAFPRSHWIGLALLGASVPLASAAPPLVLGAATAVVLAVVGAWETVVSAARRENVD